MKNVFFTWLAQELREIKASRKYWMQLVLPMIWASAFIWYAIAHQLPLAWSLFAYIAMSASIALRLPAFLAIQLEQRKDSIEKIRMRSERFAFGSIVGLSLSIFSWSQGAPTGRIGPTLNFGLQPCIQLLILAAASFSYAGKLAIAQHQLRIAEQSEPR